MLVRCWRWIESMTCTCDEPSFSTSNLVQQPLQDLFNTHFLDWIYVDNQFIDSGFRFITSRFSIRMQLALLALVNLAGILHQDSSHSLMHPMHAESASTFSHQWIHCASDPQSLVEELLSTNGTHDLLKLLSYSEFSHHQLEHV